MNTADRAAAAVASMSCLAELPAGWQPVRYAILADGSLAVLATDVDLAGEHQRIDLAWRAQVTLEPPSRLRELAAAGRARIWSMTAAGAWSEGPTFLLETPSPMLDRFADGRWLVVDSWSRDINSRVLSPDGAVIDRFRLGIGVEHLAIVDDRIWVGWDDQSVDSYGTCQIPGQEVALSPNAVLCFSDDGRPLFLPDWPEHGVWVQDPCALNADETGAWCCPYMVALEYFPLVRVVPGEATRWWHNDLTGSVAIAIDGDHAVLAGGYEMDRLALLSLPGTGTGEHAPVIATWSMPPPPPAPGDTGAPGRPPLLVGRGDTIHLVQDQIWYRWRVRDLASADRHSAGELVRGSSVTKDHGGS